MSKNTTRKGLAFGAMFALGSTLFAGIPASANIETDLITIRPTSGPVTALAILAGVGQDFSFTSIPATTITAGGNIKTVVTDLANAFLPTTVSTGVVANTDGIAVTMTASVNATTNVVTLKSVDDTVTGEKLPNELAAAGATVAYFPVALLGAAAAGDGTPFTLVPANTLVNIVANAAADTITFTSPVDQSAAAAAAVAVVHTAIAATNGVRYFTGTSSNGSFVVDSKQNTAGNTPVIELTQKDAVTRTATLVTWVDAFFGSTHKIDANEYKSKPVVATFIKADEVAWSTALTPPLVGDATINASITSVPALNGLQSGANTLKVRGLFTRQDSTTKAVSAADVTQDVDTAEWETSITTLLATTVPFLNGAGAPQTPAAWLNLAAASNGDLATTAVTLVGKVVTVTTTAATHNLRVGETVVVKAATPTSVNGDVVITSVPAANKFTYALDVADGVVGGTPTYGKKSFGIVNLAFIDRVVPGDYSAQAAVSINNGTNFIAAGTSSKGGTQAVASSSTLITTAASAAVQGASVSTDADTVVKIKTGTLTVPVIATIRDSKGVALGAGRSVTVAPSARTSTVKLDGGTGSKVLTTNALGQVTFNVTDTTGAANTTVTLTVTPEGKASAAASIKVDWVAQSFGLVDLATATSGLETTRSILAGGSYDLQLAVLDQFFQAPTAGDYQLVTSGSGVTEAIVTLVDGMATVKVVDNKINDTTFTSTVKVQKKGTTGVFATTSTTSFVSNIVSSPALVTAANGSTLYASVAAVLSAKVAEKALLELDKRVAAAVTPAYVNRAVITGKVSNSSSGSSLAGATVTLTGSSSMLFETADFAVAKRGSITVLSDSTDGSFKVNVVSTTSMTDAVVTVTALGKSVDVKLTFTGIGVGEGTSLVVTMPAAVKPASTFQVKAKLSDAFGNGVEATTGRIKVTYTGAGIVFGTLPTSTDANGDLMFSVLLGSNDTGSVNVTVSYDQNGDKDFVDVKDLNATGTTAITASGVVAASSDTIVNVGTFSGKLVVYALNAAGSEVSYKIAGKWVTQVVTSDLLMRYDRVVGATGKTIKVDIYVDGVLKLAKSVVTK